MKKVKRERGEEGEGRPGEHGSCETGGGWRGTWLGVMSVAMRCDQRRIF